ncbi:restriction endonuclease [Deltaproteobacteria bacterium PRO3]|nr:restriction endonuclease [Deltaproteobacteria bacterium PRO3]
MGNLLIVILFTFLFSIFLIYLIQKTSKRPETAEEKIPIDPGLQHLNLDQFFAICCELLEKMGLRILNSYRTEDNEIDIFAENPEPIVGGPFLAHLILYPEGAQVSSAEVQNFASNLIGERRGKGILMTTGFFAPDVAMLPELPPMEMIDGKRLAELMKHYGITAPTPERA